MSPDVSSKLPGEPTQSFVDVSVTHFLAQCGQTSIVTSSSSKNLNHNDTGPDRRQAFLELGRFAMAVGERLPKHVTNETFAVIHSGFTGRVFIDEAVTC